MELKRVVLLGFLVTSCGSATDVQQSRLSVDPYGNPCPTNGSACLIMPLGDSITAGAGSSTGGGYRVPLIRKIWGSNKNATFVGVNQSGPATVDGRPFPKNNEGYSGYTIENSSSRKGISELVVNEIQIYKPHIVTLMIGTNDIATNNDLANAPRRLSNLIDKIAAARPDTLVILAKIVPTTDDSLNTKVRAFNDAMPGIVQSKINAGKRVALVDMYGGFTSDPNYKTSRMKDGLHPNDAGYDVMANVWFPALQRFLPAVSGLKIGATYNLIARHSNKCVDAANEFKNGGKVHQWDCHGGANQKFRVINGGGGGVALQLLNTNFCIDGNNATTNGTRFYLWNCHGGANQRFSAVASVNGSFFMRVAHSQRCLDIAGVSTANGAFVHQWECLGGANQDFYFREQ